MEHELGWLLRRRGRPLMKQSEYFLPLGESSVKGEEVLAGIGAEEMFPRCGCVTSIFVLQNLWLNMKDLRSQNPHPTVSI